MSLESCHTFFRLSSLYLGLRLRSKFQGYFRLQIFFSIFFVFVFCFQQSKRGTERFSQRLFVFLVSSFFPGFFKILDLISGYYDL